MPFPFLFSNPLHSSLSNTFDVSIRTPNLKFGPSGTVNWDSIHFMAYEAVLPGTSYELGQVYGDRQGRTEQYPTKRVYPPVDVSFYVDQDYQAIRFFEAWINTMSSNKGTTSESYVVHSMKETLDPMGQNCYPLKILLLFLGM